MAEMDILITKNHVKISYRDGEEEGFRLRSLEFQFPELGPDWDRPIAARHLLHNLVHFFHKDFLDEHQMVEQIRGQAVFQFPDLGMCTQVAALAQDGPVGRRLRRGARRLALAVVLDVFSGHLDLGGGMGQKGRRFSSTLFFREHRSVRVK